MSCWNGAGTGSGSLFFLSLLPSAPRPWLIWTICGDRCLGLSGPSLPVLGAGEGWHLGLSPGPLWQGLGL